MRLHRPLDRASIVRITQRFTPPSHYGVDYSCVEGTPLYAPVSGRMFVGTQAGGFGAYVRIETGDGLYVYLAHLRDVAICGGQHVNAGEMVAYSGNTGNSTGPHLHFEVRMGGREQERAVDPETLIDWAWDGKEEVAMGRTSVLGIHTQGPLERGTPFTEALRASKIKWVKALDPDAWHTTTREMLPNQRVVARLYIGGDDQEHAYMRQGAAGADAYWQRVRGRFERLRDGGCVDWCGPNEPHPGLGENRPEILEAFWRRLIELMVAAGGRPWAWSFGVGWPDRGLAHHHVESIRMAIEAGGGLDVHEYAAPSITDGDGWLTLRIRNTLKELYEAGLPTGRRDWVLIGECGITWATIQGMPDLGWKWWPGKENGQNQYVYPPQFGLPQGVMDAERYWRHMSWLDDQYAAIPEICAATPFLSIPFERWATFDWGQEHLQRSIAKHATAPEPTPTPPTDAELGDMMQAHVLPLNPDAALEKAAAARGLGLLPASDEVTIGDQVVQVFRTDQDRGIQHIAACRIGDWGNVRWWTRKN